MANLRVIVGYTVPVITALLGLLWYFGRRKPPPDKPGERGSVNQSHGSEPKTEVSSSGTVIKPTEDGDVEEPENRSVGASGTLKDVDIPEKVKASETKDGTTIKVHSSNQEETERVEEIVTSERSSFVASRVNVKGCEDESNRRSQIELNSKPELREKVIPSPAVSEREVSGKECKTEILKNKSVTVEEEENFRDSLNLDDYDYRSYSNNDTARTVCDKDSTNAEFNEAFILSGNVNDSRTDFNSRTMETLQSNKHDELNELEKYSKSDFVSENIERTNVQNTSMSASVDDQPLMESSIMGQPLLESSTIVPSLLESSTLGQPLLESTKLDTTSSVLKDIESQIVSEQNSVTSVSNISDLNTKSDSVESKNSWADLSKGCDDRVPSVKDSEMSAELNIDVQSSAVDSGSNCSKNESRHSKDFSPEPHHKSGIDTDNGVHSSESNCDSASVDSGKGASIHDILPGISNQEPQNAQSGNRTYQCNFPTSMCGRLIGKMGKNINLIKDRSGANISLSTNPFTPEFQLCTIEGTKKQIDEALCQISHKFPDVDLSPINMSLPSNDPSLQGAGHPILMPEIMQLNLPEGVSVDVVVSSIVDAGHIFVQQHTHPSFPSLERLNQFMMACYTTDGVVPQLPRPIEVDVICAAPLMDGWYRAQISCVYEDTDECDVKFVDYGVFSRVPASSLKQIRSDFMTLPFQATECYMANVTPLQDEDYFSPEASATLEMLTQGKLLQAQVVGRTENGTPYVHVYQISGENVIFVNRELVNRGLTRWIEVLS